MAETRPAEVLQTIDSIVEDYSSAARKRTFSTFENQILDILKDDTLSTHIHSVRSRQKDPTHLRDKLLRKYDALNEGEQFQYTPDNYFEKINDLVGVRVLHLHSHQIRQINTELRRCLDDHLLPLIEGPLARTWDDESRAFFSSCGIDCVTSPSMYTSVHYIVRANYKNAYTAEIQVRTLSEEVWGETDHQMNYPHETDSIPCKEQIKALARLTSSVSRLVDSIFTSHKIHETEKARTNPKT